MTAREQLIHQVQLLSEEDARALLAIARRLARAAEVAPEGAGTAADAPVHRRHPERFGALAGSVEILGDVEAPCVGSEQWTADDGNVAS